MAAPHETVLLHEAVDALVSSPAGLYVDGTFGRGGHSREILGRLDTHGHLFACDKDEEAERDAIELAAQDSRFSFVRGSFAALPALLEAQGLGSVDGILLDLGVSSPQLDQAERGFSFQQDGPLDMRMDRSRGESAADWIASASEQEIIDVLREYGEERFARRIAGAIVRSRSEAPLTTTAQLATIVRDAHPRWEKHKHPATRTFQAIRIRVNRELDDLAELLSVALSVLTVGGRLVVISFHSLEDRLVKRHLRDMSRGPQLPRNLPIRNVESGAQMRLLGKAQRASEEEVAGNPRSRSAIMRCAEKLA
ncbi:MAG: 16S rRNA (cytosine1402-N4)-methyltransferase [Glaciecola sp.]|jgi:16S rRNA (cytosine1402-N4)-methyltransferase|uniref:16S rRNA (cytosine(1402)-N(4))-methyltransferase RsmH n=1 Tax=Congregibacter sp. TaxID=2744308 RepID=UPI0039E3E236